MCDEPRSRQESPTHLGLESSDQAELAGAPAADFELAARLRLSIQLARWGLLSTVSEVKA